MQRFRVILVAVLAIAVGGSLWATGGSEGGAKEPVKLIIFADIMSPVFEHMFARFEADTGRKLEVEALPGGTEYYRIVNSRFMAGEVPDLLVAHGTVNEYAQVNPTANLVDLTDWTAKNVAGKLLTKEFIAAQAMNGRTYGIPFTGVTVRGFFYNKKVAAAAGVTVPKNWDDFLQNVAPKVKAAGFIPVYAMGRDKWGLGFEAENYVADQFVKTDIQDRINTGKATLLDTDFRQAFELQKKIKDAGFYNDDAATGTYDGAVAALAEDRAYMTPFSIIVCARFKPEKMQDLGGFGLSKEGNRIYYSFPNYAYVPVKAKNPKGAMAFLEWFIKADSLAKYYSELKMMPPYIGVKSEMYTVAADFKRYFDAETPFVPRLKASYAQVGDYSTLILAGTKTPLEALQAMQDVFARNAKVAGIPGY